MFSILQNRILLDAVIAGVVAQVIKVLVVRSVEKRWDFSRLLETGGMPSSHTAAVIAAIVSTGLQEGWSSTYFALATIFGYSYI